MRGRLARHAFPPHVAVIGQRDVGEDNVGLEGLHGVRIRLVRRAGRDAEISGFGIDRVEPAVGRGLDPGNVVTDRRHLPAFEPLGWNQHCEIRRRRRWGGSRVGLLSLGRGNAQDQHVLGEPASSRPMTEACGGRHFL